MRNPTPEYMKYPAIATMKTPSTLNVIAKAA